MIRNEREYKEAIRRLKQDQKIIEKQKTEFKKIGLSKEEMKRALEPMLSFHEQLVEEVEWYEDVKRRHFRSISNLNEIGRLLIALRISSDLTQKDLAHCLGVNESQVSRDERNEYHGISLERAQKIMDVFGVYVKGKVESPIPLKRKRIIAELP